MRLSTGTRRVLVIPDLQVPFQHKDTLPFLKALSVKYLTSDVVCIGDLVDFNALSQYANDPNGMSALDECLASHGFLHELTRTFPEAKYVIGNHDARLSKRAFNAGIPEAMIRSLREVLHLPNTWEVDYRFEIDGVVYEHGDRAGGMYAVKRLALANMKSTVIGHHHSFAAIHYIANEGKMVFGMNVGCLCDMDTYAFRYARGYMFKPTMGAGVVIKGIPYWIPMIMDDNYRWTGDL